jgi:cysteine-rich repeat protein
MKLLIYCFLQLCIFHIIFIDTPVNAPICENTISLQYKSEFPLCGNGILDPDELCDDGNTENGDGCNSMCNMYDAFTSTCTLAGKNEACFNDKTSYGASGMPSQVSFCDLKSIDIHPNASYALIVDQNIIIKYNLFSDDTKNVISLFSVPKAFSFICSINILPDDLSVLIYDCLSHEFYLSSSTGNSGYTIATLPSYIQPFIKIVSPTFKPLVISKLRLAVTAAISKNATQPLITGFETCVYIFKFNIPTIQVLQQQSNNYESTPFQQIPCIIYNVMEGLKVYPTYSIKNMIPKYILYEKCIQPYLLNSNCYTLYMYRDDFHFLTAYIPEQGGIDIAYVLKSKDIMTNAIGFPIIKLKHLLE